MLFLTPKQQCQSTEGNVHYLTIQEKKTVDIKKWEQYFTDTCHKIKIFTVLMTHILKIGKW